MAAPPPLRWPPALMDELVEEILLRIPPDDPACLARAAVVCKRWCRLVTDPGFRRRFHQFHRTPPMLGFIIHRCSPAFTDTRFLPTSSFRPFDAGCRSWCPLDARHGRILLYHNPVRSNPERKELTVWTPATGDVRKLPWQRHLSSHYGYWNAALLCAVPGCNHMECPTGAAFTVVLVGRTTMNERFTQAYVYSSEADKWSQTSYIDLAGGYAKQFSTCGVIVGNALCFLLEPYNEILEYDLAKKELSVTELPPICKWCTVVLMSVEDGSGLGFAMVHDFFLCIWSRKPVLAPRGGWTWTQHKVVELKSFLPVPALSCLTFIVAAADAGSVFVIWASNEVMAIDLKSGRVRKVSDADGDIINIIPYMSFCTPALRAATIDEGPNTDASNNA